MKLILTLVIWFGAMAHAAPSEQFQNSLNAVSSAETRESIEVVGGARYRRIETKVGVYYLKASASENAKAEVECGTPKNASAPRALEGQVQILKRTAAFVRALQVACDDQTKEKNPVKLGPELGVRVGDRPGDVIRDKAIVGGPNGSNGLGFNGSF